MNFTSEWTLVPETTAAAPTNFDELRPLNIIGGIIAVVGAVSNLLCWITFDFMKLDSASIVLYKMLAFWDTMSIMIDGVLEMGFLAFSVDLFSGLESLIFCKGKFWLDTTSNLCAFWHVVAVTFDRFLSVTFPDWYRSHVTRFTGYIMSGAIVLFTGAFEYPIMYMASLEGGQCVLKSQSLTEEGAQFYLDFHLFAVHAVLPCGLIIVMSGLFWRNFTKMSKKGTKCEGGKKQSKRREDFEKGMKRMLVVLTMTFVLFTSIGVVMFSLDYGTEAGWWFTFAEILFVSQHAANFYLYLLSGPMFRKAFARAITRSHEPGSSTTGGSVSRSRTN